MIDQSRRKMTCIPISMKIRCDTITPGRVSTSRFTLIFDKRARESPTVGSPEMRRINRAAFYRGNKTNIRGIPCACIVSTCEYANTCIIKTPMGRDSRDPALLKNPILASSVSKQAAPIVECDRWSEILGILRK